MRQASQVVSQVTTIGPHSRRETADCLYCGEPTPDYAIRRLGGAYCCTACRDRDSLESMHARLAQLERPALDHRSLLVRRGLLQA